MAMAGLKMPLESFPLQALVSEPIKPVVNTVVMSNAVHAYISQSDKGDLVIGAGIDQYTGFGQRGSFQLQHQAYGRTGQPCPTCGTPIRRILVGQRGTHYCPKCQK